MKKIGIFGGTFNPVHKGHEIAADYFYEKFGLDELLIIPVNIPPHKENDFAVTQNDRLNMCILAFSGEQYKDKRITVSDMEIKRGQVSYTYDTLNKIREEYAAKNEYPELYFLMGSDMFLYLDKWYRYKDLFRLCTFVVTERCKADSDDENSVKIRSLAEFYKETEKAGIEFLDIEFLEMSSTQIREKIKNGENTEDYISENVSRYIENHNLYRF